MSIKSFINNLISTDTREPEPEKIIAYNPLKRPTFALPFEDGTVVEYPIPSDLSDTDVCIACYGDAFHLYSDCDGLAWELNHDGAKMRGLTKASAKAKKMHICMYCAEREYRNRKALECEYDDLEDTDESED